MIITNDIETRGKFRYLKPFDFHDTSEKQIQQCYDEVLKYPDNTEKQQWLLTCTLAFLLNTESKTTIILD